MHFIDNNLQSYVESHSDSETELLEEINREQYISRTTYIHFGIAASQVLKYKPNINIPDIAKIYPKMIHIETQAICNAKCTFCDYPSLIRKGDRMSDEMIEKIINDLSVIPENHMFVIEPYKISEPFLEKRLPSLVKLFLTFHKLSKVHIISNGNYIPEGSLQEILSLLDHCGLSASENQLDDIFASIDSTRKYAYKNNPELVDFENIYAPLIKKMGYSIESE